MQKKLLGCLFFSYNFSIVSSYHEMIVKEYRWFWGAIIESVRSGDFLLLRVASRGVGVAIELKLFRGGNRHQETRITAHFRYAWKELRRQEAELDDDGGGRLSFDGRGRDGLNSP